MKNLFKGKLGTVLILLATLVLAGVAVFTAIRLYDLRNQSVAPNAPSSVPHAAELAQEGQSCGGNIRNATACAAGLTCVAITNGGAAGDFGGTCQKVDGGNTCSLSFSLTPTASLACVNLTKNISSPKLNDQIIFSCQASGAAAGSLAFFRYNVDSGAWVEDASGTNVNITSQVATRAAAAVYKNGNWTWQCRICTDSTKSSCTTWGSPNSCTNTFSITTTPTATPIPLCNSVCTSTAQCTSGLTCNIPTGATSGNCRNTACTSESSCVCATTTPTPTTTPNPSGTPNSCNGTCGSNFNCQDGLMCYQGFCRNPSCASNSSCSCGGTATATPTAPTLPQSGTDWPTVAGFGLGVFVIIGSLLLAL